jgi:hypothetical protein
MIKGRNGSELLSGGLVIREPAGLEKGYWVGAPGVFHAKDEKCFYLTYRIRRPRGIVPDRGGEARIARSTDLKHFEDIWSVTKDKYNSASIERSAIRKGLDGQWRYWTSYVDPVDGRWCVGVLKGRVIKSLDASKVERVFSAGPLGLEGIKDPYICEENGRYLMFLSVAVATPKTRKESHETLDIFNTGECVSATGLAVSTDLDSWQWQGVIFAPEKTGWDRYCRRINSVIAHGGQYFAPYDGSASEAENYEERTGLAVSSDLKSWRSLTPENPSLTSPHTSHSLRYMDALVIDQDVCLFYEFARPDGAHDLRLFKTKLESITFNGAQA